MRGLLALVPRSPCCSEVVTMVTPRSSRMTGAGASAHAQYRAKLAEGRIRRWVLRAGLALLTAVAVGDRLGVRGGGGVAK
ncbi:hypothetical protein [Streptosporangium canum]|uniref:hypothetical protein n=1 Tax=Streptosporangium canum TaxID=324952 RepID=UPI0037B89C90